jgi:agmatinase
MKVLPESDNFLAIEEEYSSLEKSKIAILSAPYEHTVSYGGGAGKGPQAIIDASQYVEFYDNEFDRELCFDKGIATIEPIDFKKRIDADALELIEKNVELLLEHDKFVVTLGGEHTISTAPIKAYHKKFPNMSILHFDAHSDLRDSYEGSKYSHASIMARVCEFFPPEKITQVGIRAQCIEEAQFIKEKGINTFYAWQIRRDGEISKNWKERVVDSLGDEVYITFDIDYFDPSIMPATGTPEADGMLYAETIELLKLIAQKCKKIIGFDMVELAPIEGLHHCDIMAAGLVYKLLNIAFMNEK